MQYTAILSIILALVALVLFAIPQKKRQSVFTDDKGQDFEESIRRFNAMTDRAKATFLYRFTESLSDSHLLTLGRYVNKRINKLQE